VWGQCHARGGKKRRRETDNGPRSALAPMGLGLWFAVHPSPPPRPNLATLHCERGRGKGWGRDGGAAYRLRPRGGEVGSEGVRTTPAPLPLWTCLAACGHRLRQYQYRGRHDG